MYVCVEAVSERLVRVLYEARCLLGPPRSVSLRGMSFASSLTVPLSASVPQRGIGLAAAASESPLSGSKRGSCKGGVVTGMRLATLSGSLPHTGISLAASGRGLMLVLEVRRMILRADSLVSRH